ncbi:hypothetical protein [Ornithinimicrobium cavernae]|uniref:hypothetical protein n=1 Tax=Ornithinimicrobium cavernae TaxID=2666047 RepID=UPI0012B17A49|nr:hypothetical protein [Ornithinimicrobium cavernae]
MTISRFRAAAPLLALTIALGLGACGTETEDPGGATDDPAPTSSETQPPADDAEQTSDNIIGKPEDSTVTALPPTEGGALPTGPVPDDVLASDGVQAAIADLAERESVEPDQVSAVGYFEVTWSDGSIGCPKPGMSYTQALVPGHLLVLQVEDQQFSYHAGKDPKFSFCADPKLPADTGGAATS